MIALLVFLFLVAFQMVRMARAEAHLLKYRLRLFALRDRLRRIAIEDARLGKNWLFPYLDSTISATIDMLPAISGWQTLALVPVARSRRESLRVVDEQLRNELNKPGNVPLREIYRDMWQEVANQLSDRHFVLRAEMAVLATAFHRVKKFKVVLRKRERRSLESVLLREPKNVNSGSQANDCVMMAAG